jgi:hypothetical protein
MYVWEKTQSSGGLELYQRVKVNKKENEDIWSYYRLGPYQHLFNAFSNKWDICEDFCFGDVDDSYDSDDEYNSDDGYRDQGYLTDFVSQPTHLPPLPTPMDVESSPTTSFAYHSSQDPIKTMSLVYGYVPHMGASDRPSGHDWDAILKFLGFVKDLKQLDVPKPEKSAIMNHFSSVVSNKQAGLIANTFATLSALFTFENVGHPLADLFVFSSPRSSACQWVLGVHSPVAALYICRYILENPQAHTIMTVADRLLDQGIPFHTLLPLHCSPHLPRSTCRGRIG